MFGEEPSRPGDLDLGARLLDGINSTESETLSRMNTLGNLIATCAIADKADHCDAFLQAAGNARSSLGAIEHIARNPSEAPGAIFDVHVQAYVAPKSDNPQERKAGVIYVPCLQWSPDDFAMTIRIAGGGIYAPGRIGFDAEGHLWSGQNWMPGGQNGAIRGLPEKGKLASTFTVEKTTAIAARFPLRTNATSRMRSRFSSLRHRVNRADDGHVAWCIGTYSEEKRWS